MSDPLFEKISPVGLEAFGTLQAEGEPWLVECFVPPEDFPLMGEVHSIAVFGGPGSGKSAVCEMLLRQCHTASGEVRCLTAHWQPMPSVPQPSAGFHSVPGQVAYVFDACAMALLQHLAEHPLKWSAASDWIRHLLTWFTLRFIQGDLQARTGFLLQQYAQAGAEVLQQFLNAELERDLLPPHNWSLVAAELSKALSLIGLESLWIVVDGLEPWVDTQPDQLSLALGAFFSTLPLFENAALVYKAFIPERLRPTLVSTAGVMRRRIQAYHLDWREEQLVEIVERRLALVMGREFQLEDLCSAEGFHKWLRRGGGDRPRAWLKMVRPLVVDYVSSQRSEPIGKETWRELRRQSPPPLFIDEERMRAIVGGREVPVQEMTSGGFRLLSYLHQNIGRVVPWKELYYRGYRGLPSVPRAPQDEGYEDWFSCERTLHSRISDLRKAIEPDPRDPVYLETVKGKGIRLIAVW